MVWGVVNGLVRFWPHTAVEKNTQPYGIYIFPSKENLTNVSFFELVQSSFLWL